MDDKELAIEIERRRGGTDMLNSVLMPHQWDQIIAALRREPERGVYCWLIESDHSTYYSGSRYGYEAEHYFFGEPFRAIRYTTKAEADEKIQREDWKNVKAVEHHFDERPPSGEMVMMLEKLLQASENMRHGGYRDALVAAYDGWAHEARALLSAAEAEGRKP